MVQGIPFYGEGLAARQHELLARAIVRRQWELGSIKHRVFGDGGCVVSLTKRELDEELFPCIKVQLGDFEFNVLGFAGLKRQGDVTGDDIRLKVCADDVVESIVGQRAEVAEIGDVELGSIGTGGGHAHVEGAIEMFHLRHVGTTSERVPCLEVKESALNSGMVIHHLP